MDFFVQLHHTSRMLTQKIVIVIVIVVVVVHVIDLIVAVIVIDILGVLDIFLKTPGLYHVPKLR